MLAKFVSLWNVNNDLIEYIGRTPNHCQDSDPEMDWRTQFSMKMEKTALRKSELDAWKARFPISFEYLVCLDLPSIIIFSLWSVCSHWPFFFLPLCFAEPPRLAAKRAGRSRPSHQAYRGAPCKASSVSTVPRMLFAKHAASAVVCWTCFSSFNQSQSNMVKTTWLAHRKPQPTVNPQRELPRAF